MTHKFVFDPHALVVRPVAASPRARRARSRPWLALAVLAVAASIFGFTVVQAAAHTDVPAARAAR